MRPWVSQMRQVVFIMPIDSNKPMQRFGEKLRALREQHGLSLRKFANELGYSTHTHIARIEWGQKYPPIPLIFRIADYFDVPIEQLMRDELELDE